MKLESALNISTIFLKPKKKTVYLIEIKNLSDRIYIYRYRERKRARVRERERE